MTDVHPPPQRQNGSGSQRPSTESRYRRSRSTIVIGTLLAMPMALAANLASARTEIVRWTHPNVGAIARFEVLVGTSSRNYGAPVSVGLPQADALGVFSASVDVADGADVFLAIRAVDTSGRVSLPSNERFRPAPAVSPPPPPPSSPAPTPGVSAGSVIPPDPNAVVRFDFDSGSAPNWLDTRANNSMLVDDSLFTVVSVGGNPALSTRSGSLNIHSHFVGSPSGLKNLILTGRLAIETAGGGAGVTAYSQYPSSDTYYRLRTNGGNYTFELAGHPHSTFDCRGTTDTGVVAEVGSWYEFELTIANEGAANRISASVWKQGSPRPTTPQAECLDSTANRPLSGTIGVWSGGTGAKYWDDLEVVPISGTAAPTGPPLPPVLLNVEAVN